MVIRGTHLNLQINFKVIEKSNIFKYKEQTITDWGVMMQGITKKKWEHAYRLGVWLIN